MLGVSRNVSSCLFTDTHFIKHSRQWAENITCRTIPWLVDSSSTAPVNFGMHCAPGGGGVGEVRHRNNLLSRETVDQSAAVLMSGQNVRYTDVYLLYS